MLEKRINDSAAELSDIEEKIKNLEGMQISLVHSVEEVRTTSSEIERTASIWLPKYEAKKERRCYL
jgi:predicted  nucleic acid-binding Zn-ribbon protein